MVLFAKNMFCFPLLKYYYKMTDFLSLFLGFSFRTSKLLTEKNLTLIRRVRLMIPMMTT